MADENQAETIATLAKLAGSPAVTTAELPDGRTFIIHRDDMRVEQVTIANKVNVLMPKLVTQHVKMQTTGSLIDYVNRFKNDDSLIFADIDNNQIMSLIDYHGEPTVTKSAKEDSEKATSAQAMSTDPSPKLALHRATLKLPFSLEWQVWTGMSGKLMSHIGFATFLEENSIDVVSPIGADLLELCRDLQVLQNVSFGSTVRMGDAVAINYQKEADATSKGSVPLPPSIMLSIPVYFGEPKVSVLAFMRRKVEDGKLHLGFQLSRAENVRQDEFHRIVDAVKDETESLTTVYGTPA